MNPRRLFHIGWLLAGLALAQFEAHAGTVIWSGGAAVLTLADQTTLAAAGSLVQIGYFVVADADLAAGTNTLAQLTSSFVPLQAAAVGDGAGASPGIWTTSFSGDFVVTNAAFAGRQIYLWMLNAPQVIGATQTSICKFTATFPTDDPAPGSAEVDLGDVFGAGGTLLVGTLGTGTISTVVGDLPPVHMADIPANSGPAVVTGPFLTNAVLQTGGLIVAMAGVPAVFHATAVDPNHDLITYLWDFGDGATGSGEFASHTYTNCEPFNVTLAVTDGTTTNTSPLLVTVPCAATVSSLQLKSKFNASNGDSVKLVLLLDLPAGFAFAGHTVLVDVGGAQDTFVMGAKGKGVGTFGNCKVKFDTKLKAWRLTVALKGGAWHDDWAAFGLANTTIFKKSPRTVSLPVVVLIDTAAYMDEPSLSYSATHDKTGSAKK